ncbi:MAG: hypothetical protein DHS20C20_05390 [Ardenticatenaceae bacterium]|nr:MAG: hypothetical protein DHS20C20_05390 [Ardenticatenaceae bacterium]
MTQLLVLNNSTHFVIGWLANLLEDFGLQLSPSFNLRAALPEDIVCNCPHHADNCDCDLTVLLVYGAEPQPATLLAHSHNGRTWLSLVDGGEERSSSDLSLQIKSALAAPQQ